MQGRGSGKGNEGEGRVRGGKEKEGIGVGDPRVYLGRNIIHAYVAFVLSNLLSFVTVII